MRNIWHIASVVHLIIFHLMLDHLHRTFIIWALKEIVIFLTVCLILLGLVYVFSGCSKLALNILDASWWLYHIWRVTVSLLIMKSQRLIRLIQSSNLLCFLVMADLRIITLAFTLCHAQRLLIWIVVSLDLSHVGSVIIAHDSIIIIHHWRLTSISGSTCSISWIRYLFSTSLSLLW